MLLSKSVHPHGLRASARYEIGRYVLGVGVFGGGGGGGYCWNVCHCAALYLDSCLAYSDHWWHRKMEGWDFESKNVVYIVYLASHAAKWFRLVLKRVCFCCRCFIPGTPCRQAASDWLPVPAACSIYHPLWHHRWEPGSEGHTHVVSQVTGLGLYPCNSTSEGLRSHPSTS